MHCLSPDSMLLADFAEKDENVQGEKLHATNLSAHIHQQRLISLMVVEPRFWNRSTYNLQRLALQAMLQHAQKLEDEKIGVPRLSAK